MLAARFLRLSRPFLSFSSVQNIHLSRGAFLPVVQFKLSDIGEGIAEVQIKEWHVKVGDTVSQFDNLCEVQSDKAAVTITSRYDGVVKKLLYNVDDVARIGQPLLEIEVAEGASEEAEASKEPEKAAAESAPKAAAAQAPPAAAAAAPATPAGQVLTGKVLATPAVRRVAIENKVDLKQVRGSGKDGRVLKEDVLKFLGQVKEDYFPGTTDIRSSPAVGAQPALKQYAPLAEDRVVPIRGYTRAMIKTMTEALKIPHFGCKDEVSVDRLVSIRKELKELAQERGVKLSYMPFFIKAASLALLEFPAINASVDDKLENIIYKASHNICLAMDTPGGLVVPNIKNCEQRSIFEIAAELQRLIEDGKRERITREDLAGGTFTLSNVGMIGATYASPVIFPPQVAIGAIGKIEKLPRYDKHDNLVPTHILKVSWAADHRVVDGATMVRFGNRWKFYLEHPSAMLAQLK